MKASGRFAVSRGLSHSEMDLLSFANNGMWQFHWENAKLSSDVEQQWGGRTGKWKKDMEWCENAIIRKGVKLHVILTSRHFSNMTKVNADLRDICRAESGTRGGLNHPNPTYFSPQIPSLLVDLFWSSDIVRGESVFKTPLILRGIHDFGISGLITWSSAHSQSCTDQCRFMEEKWW